VAQYRLLLVLVVLAGPLQPPPAVKGITLLLVLLFRLVVDGVLTPMLARRVVLVLVLLDKTEQER
jgi:hypothetical protein